MADTPEFGPIPKWSELSGVGRSATYELLAAGHLRGIKCGRRLLIDIPHGLRYLRSLPPVQMRPRTTPRRRSTATLEQSGPRNDPGTTEAAPVRRKARVRA